MDIVFVLDVSGSIRSERFKFVENMTLDIIDGLEIGSTKTRVGVIVYSDSASTVLRLNDFYAKQVGVFKCLYGSYDGMLTNAIIF